MNTLKGWPCKNFQCQTRHIPHRSSLCCHPIDIQKSLLHHQADSDIPFCLKSIPYMSGDELHFLYVCSNVKEKQRPTFNCETHQRRPTRKEEQSRIYTFFSNTSFLHFQTFFATFSEFSPSHGATLKLVAECRVV